MNKPIIGAAMAAALLLGACGGEEPAAAPTVTVTAPVVSVTMTPTPTVTRNEGAFLVKLSTFKGVSDSVKLALGNQACDLLEQGATPDEVGQELGADLLIAGFESWQSVTFGQAVTELCPGALS